MSIQIGRQIGQELAPIFGAGLGSGVPTDPFLSAFGLNEPILAPQTRALEKAANEGGKSISKFLTEQIFNVVKPAAKPKQTAPAAPAAPSGSNNTPAKGTSSPDDFIKNKVTARDFKRPLQIAATGAAVTAAGIGVNETAKQLGDTLNDAVDTTGKAIQNVAEGIGKGVDGISDSVGKTLAPLLDPLGIKDPATQKSIGGLVVAVGIIGVAALTLYLVMKRK